MKLAVAMTLLMAVLGWWQIQDGQAWPAFLSGFGAGVWLVNVLVVANGLRWRVEKRRAA